MLSVRSGPNVLEDALLGCYIKNMFWVSSHSFPASWYKLGNGLFAAVFQSAPYAPGSYALLQIPAVSIPQQHQDSMSAAWLPMPEKYALKGLLKFFKSK